MNEIWKPVFGYEESYEVSNTGKVKSIDRVIHTNHNRIYHRKEMILKPSINKYGYLQVALSLDNKLKSYPIHRLVAISFIPNTDNKMTVNHRDGNKLNNNIDNLEWATKSEQSIHSLSLGLRTIPNSWNGKFGGDHCASKKVIQMDLKGNYITEFDSIIEASNLMNVHPSGITKVCKGTCKSCRGYTWKYKF